MTVPTIQSRGDINSGKHWLAWFFSAPFIFSSILTPCVLAQDEKPSVSDIPSHDILTPDQWIEVRASIDRALVWLASQQAPDGSFPSQDIGQPAVTALCVLAFLSAGHLPGEGPYGKNLDRAIEFVLSCRRQEGLLSYLVPEREHISYAASHTAIYNHAIGGLMLSEVFGMTTAERAEILRSTIENALSLALGRQAVPKRYSMDQGGWRYVRPWGASDSDLSVTSWLLLFMRSAKNAGFSVPSRNVDAAVNYIRQLYDDNQGVFNYAAIGSERHTSRAMCGAGIFSLSLAGMHEIPQARKAGDWLLKHTFADYRGNGGLPGDDRYFYGAFYCSQAMHQLGGQYWSSFYPQLVNTLLKYQQRDGAWSEEPGGDGVFGNHYTTALAVLALSTPYQLLPICQR